MCGSEIKQGLKTAVEINDFKHDARGPRERAADAALARRSVGAGHRSVPGRGDHEADAGRTGAHHPTLDAGGLIEFAIDVDRELVFFGVAGAVLCVLPFDTITGVPTDGQLTH